MATLVLETNLGRVRHLHINSPDNLNALSGAMIRALTEKFAPENLSDASVVLLTSAGRHFGAGHDLGEMASGKYDANLFRQCSNLMQLVATCPIPVLAAVQGCAFAAGCQLAASCDVVLAAVGARFATPGVRIGLFCSTPSVAVTRAATAKVAAEMLFAGKELSASEALAAGLVSRIVASEAPAALLEEALRTCHTIAESPREVLVAGKALLVAQRGQTLEKAYDTASAAMERGMTRQVAAEGISAFLEKRPACWACEDFEVERAVKLVCEGVAVVGASANAARPSHDVFCKVRNLAPAYAVNPTCAEVAGAPTYANLAAVPSPFAVVNIFRASGAPAAEAIDEALALARQVRGIRAIWLQEGVRAPEAERRARAQGLVVVADRCLAVELRKRGLLHGASGTTAAGPPSPSAKL